jgi:hypothetical protein
MVSSEHGRAIAQRITEIRQSLPERVRLIAVTKTVPVDAMRVAYEAGIRDFGESRVQEAIAKQEALADLQDITWHLIGHLQSNKAAKALEHFQWIHSVDSLKLALRLDQIAGERSLQPNICLQVKIVPDPSKFGWSISDLMADLPELDQLVHLKIVGLMIIPPYGLATTDSLSVFTQARELAGKIAQESWENIRMEQLSMGMSDDYHLAVQTGSTMVRLGRILFGERS